MRCLDSWAEPRRRASPMTVRHCRKDGLRSGPGYPYHEAPRLGQAILYDARQAQKKSGSAPGQLLSARRRHARALSSGYTRETDRPVVNCRAAKKRDARGQKKKWFRLSYAAYYYGAHLQEEAFDALQAGLFFGYMFWYRWGWRSSRARRASSRRSSSSRTSSRRSSSTRSFWRASPFPVPPAL